jgi:hypothetical protein
MGVRPMSFPPAEMVRRSRLDWSAGICLKRISVLVAPEQERNWWVRFGLGPRREVCRMLG